MINQKQKPMLSPYLTILLPLFLSTCFEWILRWHHSKVHGGDIIMLLRNAQCIHKLHPIKRFLGAFVIIKSNIILWWNCNDSPLITRFKDAQVTCDQQQHWHPTGVCFGVTFLWFHEFSWYIPCKEKGFWTLH